MKIEIKNAGVPCGCVVLLLLCVIVVWLPMLKPAQLLCYAPKLTNHGWEKKPAYCWSTEFRAEPPLADTPTPEPTEIIYPTETEWEPWSTATRVPTQPFITDTPEPYPAESEQ